MNTVQSRTYRKFLSNKIFRVSRSQQLFSPKSLETCCANSQSSQSQKTGQSYNGKCDLGASVGCERVSEHSTRRD